MKSTTSLFITLLLIKISFPAGVYTKSPKHVSLASKFKKELLFKKTLTNVNVNNSSTLKVPKKDWNLIVYMAANNNLHRFALHNFRQMLRIGSSDYINILLQIDEFGESEVTRFYIEQQNATIYEVISNTPEAISGTPESLYGFLRWAITTFPAQRHAVLLWNHGSGIKDPSIWGKYYSGNRNKFFFKDAKTGLMTLNRKKNNLRMAQGKGKGIAFNEVHQTYINNQELRLCLEKVCSNLLSNNKIDIIFMDACHMGMAEMGSELQDAANYLVGSEEIEPGTGYNYSFLLEPFLKRSLSPKDFIKHSVKAYEREYSDAFADFTQAALYLDNFSEFESKFSNFSKLLLQFMQEDNYNFSTLRRIRKSFKDTTEFFDEDYIDLRHFLRSLLTLIQNNKNFRTSSITRSAFIHKFEKSIIECLKQLDRIILAYATGVNLTRAGGLGLYFPKKIIHHSYLKTIFSQVTQWSDFLKEFTRKNREL